MSAVQAVSDMRTQRPLGLSSQYRFCALCEKIDKSGSPAARKKQEKAKKSDNREKRSPEKTCYSVFINGSQTRDRRNVWRDV